ncbi:MAG: hypothetical protein M3R00_06970, partial [Pseudomonadota bacterium]|nr:hypothetical protein [Pseudomonadota bacterium]
MKVKSRGNKAAVSRVHDKQKLVNSYDPLKEYGTNDPELLELYEPKKEQYVKDLMSNEGKKIANESTQATIEAAFTLRFTQGKTEINLLSTAFLQEKSKVIRVKGKVVGEVHWENGKLTVNCSKDVNLSVEGDVDCQDIDIQAVGKITLNSRINPRQQLKLKAAEVVINNAISMAKTVQIDADKVTLNSSLVAGHTTVNAKQISIAKHKKIISPITIIKADNIQNSGDIKAKLACNIDAQTMNNQGNVTAALLYIQASKKLNNEGKLYGAFEAQIKGGEVTNRDSIRSKSQIDLNVKSYVNDRNAHLVAKDMLQLHAETIEAKGEVKSKVLALSADKLILHTQLQSRKLDIDAGHLTLQNVNFELPMRNQDELQDKALSGAHSLVVRKGMVVSKGSRLQLKQTLSDIQGNSEILGEMQSDHSRIAIENIRVEGKVSSEHCDLKIKNTAINKKGSFNAETSSWEGGSIASCGSLNIQNCPVKCNGIAISEGQATFNYSKIELMNNLQAQKNTNSVFNHCNLQMKELNFYGDAKITVNDSELTTNLLNVEGKLIGVQSNFAVKQDINVGLKANFELSKNSTVTADVLHSHGQMSLTNSHLIAAGLDQQAGGFTSKQSTNTLSKGLKQEEGSKIVLEKSILSVPMVMASGSLVAQESIVQGQRAQLNGKIDFNSAEIKFNEQFITGEESVLNAKSVKLDFNLCQWRGAVDIQDAEIKAKRSAGKGAMRIRKSRISIDDEFQTSAKANLILESTKLQSEKTVFTGKVFADHAKIKSGVYVQEGKTAYNNSAIKTKNRTEVCKDSELKFKNGLIKSAGTFEVAANSKIKNSVVAVKDYSQTSGKLQAKSAKITVEQDM